jgi:hypothetical protein
MRKSTCKHPDGQAGHTDGDHLEHPPGAGQQKDCQSAFAFRGERKTFSLGIDGVRPGRGGINKGEQQYANSHEQIFFPVEAIRGNSC